MSLGKVSLIAPLWINQSQGQRTKENSKNTSAIGLNWSNSAPSCFLTFDTVVDTALLVAKCEYIRQ